MAKGRSTVRTDRARRTFLEQLAETCNVSHSARSAGMSRDAAYCWRDDDRDFAAAWEQALESAADKLEQVAFERAKEGKSDRMLEILLKAHRPKYREKQAVELTGRDGGAIEIDQVNTDADAFTSAIAGLASRNAATGGDSETQH